MKYKVHRFEMKMTKDTNKLEHFLNGLKGEVVAVIPNVTPGLLLIPVVDFLLIVEREI